MMAIKDSILGKWVNRDGEWTRTYEFRRDGTYSVTSDWLKSDYRSDGKYSIHFNIIVLDNDDDLDFEEIGDILRLKPKGASDSTDYKKENTKGCYIATCIYGSYNCPEVWTLRRYRDNILNQSLSGRLFVKAYYSISPKIVSLLGEKLWFHMLWKPILRKFVNNLHKHGIASSPYQDRS